MSLANNIVKYRKKNHLSQEELSKSLNISRQSISKWETGENLPSINNLISLSGMLNISLDELITGEPYLHFPFDFGRPQNRKPVLVMLIILSIIGFISFESIHGSVLLEILNLMMIEFIFYLLIIYISPIDYKNYYNYWTIGRSGIKYPSINRIDKSVVKELIMPIEALLHLRRTKYLSYKQIKQMEIILDLYDMAPKSIISFDWYFAGYSQLMQEKFYLEVTTIDNEKIVLNLRQYYWKESKEHKMLPTIISFLQRKNFRFVDKQGITDMVKDKNSILINDLYDKRDSLRRKRTDVSSK